MSRTRELTWTVGSGSRRGRWRKKYRNRVHYFDGGRGKSDQAAYQAALTAWKQTKARIDAESPSPHHKEYQAAIDRWQEVLACARLHESDEITAAAIERLNRLRNLQKRGARKPPSRDDLFENFFELEVRRPKYAAAIKDFGKRIDLVWKGSNRSDRSYSEVPDSAALEPDEVPQSRRGTLIVPDLTMFDPDELAVEKIVWRDRLDVMRRRPADLEKTIDAQVRKYLEIKEAKAAAGELTHGRYRKLTIQLKAFVNWVGSVSEVTMITSQKLMEYREFLLQRVGQSEWSSSTAGDHLVSLKSFVRWLYRTEAISTLPRVMDAGSHELEIRRATSPIITFTKLEISQLLTNASPRTRLYILLTLNTSMTQKDIADLKFNEVDLTKGEITRKRSKTKRFDSTPYVTYKLWPETLTLLRREKNCHHGGRVLVNARGTPLCAELIDAHGNYRKVDNVRSAFDRLKRKLGIEKSFISLKKTSASELAGSKEFSGVKSFFLGHAPTSIADKHYALAPGELLNDAIWWLRDRFKIEETLRLVGNENASGRGS